MKTAILCALSGLLLCASATAQLNAQSCQADIQQYCADVKPGGGAIATCLKKHKSSLSSSCNQYRQAVKNKVIAFIKACNNDIKTHCAGVQPGEGRIYVCLRKHKTELGATCNKQMTSVTK